MLQLRLPCRDASLSDARQDLLAGLSRLLLLPSSGGSAALAHGAEEAVDLAALEKQVADREHLTAHLQTEIQTLCGEHVLRPSLPAASNRNSGVAAEGVVHMPDLKLTHINTSSCGQYTALAAASGEVVLLEACTAGFRSVATLSEQWQSLASAVCSTGALAMPPSTSPVAALQFFDADANSPALLLAVEDLCLGWEPLALPRTGGPPNGREGCCRPSGRELFACVPSASGQRITALSTARSRSAWIPRELLMFVTDHGLLEIFDLCLYDTAQTPILLKALQPEGPLVAAKLSADGELVMVATADPSGGAGKLYGYTTDTGYCAVSLCLHGRPAQLAHCDGEALLASCTTEGLLEVFCTASPGPALVRVDTAPATALDTDSELTVANVSLAWCDGKRWLAMAGHPHTVLVYTYQETREALLELSVVLHTDTEPTVPVPRGLAWAPGLGVLLAVHDSTCQFWLLDSSLVQEGVEESTNIRSSSATQANTQQDAHHPQGDAAAAAVIERLGADGLGGGVASELADLLGADAQDWEEEEAAKAARSVDAHTTSIFNPDTLAVAQR